jgi:hypothetical protein
MDAFVAQSIKTGLRRMFQPSRHFDICEVRSCLAAADIPEPPELKELHPLHCVSWSEMEPEFRAEVARRTLALFEGAPFVIEDIVPSLAPGSPGLLNKLLGKGMQA